MNRIKIIRLIALAFIFILTGPVADSAAKDTDIYKISAKQNCYMLMDNSGSMAFGVYEHTVDYGAMYDYLYCLNDSACGYDYIYDKITGGDFYQNHYDPNKIYLLKGEIGVRVTTVDGETTAFTGDPADPEYVWHTSNMVDTHTVIDKNGDLADDPDGTANQRLTVDSTTGQIRLDGNTLPIGQDIKLHEFKTLYDGTVVDNGFGGLLNAPGYYFSGYEGVAEGSLNPAEGGESEIYFFVTGNWINMQTMYNLYYSTNNPNPSGASTDDQAWKYESVPDDVVSAWSRLSYKLDYPQGSGRYGEGLLETDTEKSITHPGAIKMQVHFSSFDVKDGDHVTIKNQNGTTIATYDNQNNPTDGDGWSPTVSGDTVNICLASDSDGNTGQGYEIDMIKVAYGQYLMQSRIDVAKDAMLYTLDAFYGKMNWGFASFKDCNGAQFGHAINPNETDDVNTNSVKNAVENLSADGGTPLGEALQDVFEHGYYDRKSSLDNLPCRKNYIISVSDGYPSCDTDWDRIDAVTISDTDGDGWTADPYQYDNPGPNYYDDVAHWMYTHSWQDKSEVPDPANSYENVITHHIAFGADHPLMKDAAGESGGEYVTAYNKSQLVSAFYALALKITDAVSFTAPVVSVDAANKIQNGDDLYLGLFLPQDNKAWMGNLKKFRLGNEDDPDNAWMVYDGGGNLAVNSDGEFIDNAAAFWADDNDANDEDDYGAADVTEDGVGEILKERIESDFSSGNYYLNSLKFKCLMPQAAFRHRWPFCSLT